MEIQSSSIPQKQDIVTHHQLIIAGGLDPRNGHILIQINPDCKYACVN